MKDTDGPANQNQNSTDLGIPDDCEVQGVADDHKVVIGLLSQKSSNPANNVKKKKKNIWVMQTS